MAMDTGSVKGLFHARFDKIESQLDDTPRLSITRLWPPGMVPNRPRLFKNSSRNRFRAAFCEEIPWKICQLVWLDQNGVGLPR